MTFKRITIIILFLSTTILFPQDKKSVKKQIIHDTTYLPVPSDSMSFTVKSTEYLPKLSWWDRNEASLLGAIFGALVGALAASLIAHYSVMRTHKNTVKIENEKIAMIRRTKENIYCGLLFMIYSEIFGHRNLAPILKESISLFLDTTEATKDIVSDTPFTRYEIEFLKECRSKILEFENFETEILTVLSHYINKVSLLNYYLNLKRIRDIRFRFDGNEEDFLTGVKDYFNDVNDLISNLGDVGRSIQESVLTEIKKFPQNDIDIEKLMKGLDINES